MPALSFGQVVVSSETTNPSAQGSAVLELQSPDMGLLIPKVEVTDLSVPDPVDNPATGLLIYNTCEFTNPGFYYWTGKKWTQVLNEEKMFTIQEYGDMFEVLDDIPTTVTLISNAQWYGWKTAQAGPVSSGISLDLNQPVADKLYVSESGFYKVELSMSVSSPENQQIVGSVWITDNSGGPSIEKESRVKVFNRISQGNELVSGSSFGILELGEGQGLDLRFQSASNNGIMYIYAINLVVCKVGE